MRGQGAARLAVPYVEADDAGAAAPADEPVAGPVSVAADERGSGARKTWFVLDELASCNVCRS